MQWQTIPVMDKNEQQQQQQKTNNNKQRMSEKLQF